MGFRFRKIVKIAPGVRLNLSKSGLSSSIGRPGAPVNVGKRGTHLTVGAPGTGMSYRTRIDGAEGVAQRAAGRRRSAGPGGALRMVIWLVAIAAVLAVLLA